jgi:hypothetical protein
MRPPLLGRVDRGFLAQIAAKAKGDPSGADLEPGTSGLADALPAAGEDGEIVMMRTIAVATLLAATLAAPSAFAQAIYQHHRYCLRAATGFECAFNTMAECREAAAAGTSGTCMRNTLPMNHPLRRR